MRRRAGCCISILAFILVLLAVAYFGAGVYARHKIEKAVEAQLIRKIGPAKSYKVIASGDTIQMASGNLKEIQITGEQVQLRNGLVLDEMHSYLKGIKFNLNERSIKSIDSMDFAANVTESELNGYVEGKYTDIPGLHIDLRDNDVLLTAEHDLGGFNLKLTADGTFGVSNGSDLVLNINNISAVGFKVPGIAKGLLKEKMNPIISTANWGFKPTLTSVNVTRDKVTLSGKADFVDIGKF